MGQFVHVRLDQFLEAKHHARPALRVGRRPGRLRCLRRGHRAIEIGLSAKGDARLHAACIRVEHLACAIAFAFMVDDQMVDDSHARSPIKQRAAV